MSKRNGGNDTKKLAVCAMLSALGVVLLYAGALVEVVDISMAVIASLLCVVAVIEYGGGASWMIYGVTSIISLLLLPNKTPAALYAVFFGFYPILKEKFEKRQKMISWLLKEITFNASLVLMGAVSAYALSGSGSFIFDPILIGIAVVLCEVVFVLYDIALTRLISFYILKLRSRFKF